MHRGKQKSEWVFLSVSVQVLMIEQCTYECNNHKPTLSFCKHSQYKGDDSSMCDLDVDLNYAERPITNH
jgi:hypothetical protein